MKLMQKNRILTPLVLLSTVAVLAGCGSKYPGDDGTAAISGTLYYSGTDLDQLSQPAVGVFAFATWPPQGPPHGNVLMEFDTIPSAGLPFEMENLPPWDYYILAQVFDLAGEPDAVIAAGAYPDYCSFGSNPVQIVADEENSSIDFALYDDEGTADPCGDPGNDIVPEVGKASVALHVYPPDGYSVAAADTMSLALFTSWPPSGMPVGFKQLTGNDISFPQLLVNNSVNPGAYAVSMCLDLGGDNMMCDGPEDLQVVYSEGELVNLSEGQIFQLRIDLEQGTATIVQN